MSLWNEIEWLAVPSETVREHLDKLGWIPDARTLAAIICHMKVPLAQKREFLLRLDPAGDETLAAQIQALLQDWERTLQGLADDIRHKAKFEAYREDGTPMELPTGLTEDPAHFINDPPALEAVPLPFHVGDIVRCADAGFQNALYLGSDYGLVIPAGEDRRRSPWTTFSGQDGARLGVEFLNEQGNFIRREVSLWELERSTPLDMEQTSWRYLKQGSDLLLGRGSFCAFLSAREAFCREFLQARKTRHAEIDAILKGTVERLERGEMECMSAEEYFAERKKRWAMTEEEQAQGRRGALDEQG